MDKNIRLRPKTDKTQTITIRVPVDLVQEFDELVKRTNYSRNALIVKAMEYWSNHLEIVDEEADDNKSEHE